MLLSTESFARQLWVRFEQWLQALGVGVCRSAVVEDLTLADYEALANAVERAYDPDHLHPVMHLQARIERTTLLITVTDHGRWRILGEPGYRSRGLAMMRSLTIEVDLRPSIHGTTVHLRAALPLATTTGWTPGS
ncbi:MAG TPA: ATP-binding protein [Pseudonocardiaceae bacterium]|nr:ATP-binding protein [Pseudonocardiaceae bacterium]